MDISEIGLKKMLTCLHVYVCACMFVCVCMCMYV